MVYRLLAALFIFAVGNGCGGPLTSSDCSVLSKIWTLPVALHGALCFKEWDIKSNNFPGRAICSDMTTPRLL